MQICAPAIVYIGFSLTHIIIDTFKQLYNSAFMKFLVMIVFTLVLYFMVYSFRAFYFYDNNK
jgi:hypothetical protein